ncbi:FcoT family thioesterase [Streptomyces sp. NPDC018031]|uniref:FcoT family thioesterase n=1 Tax=Streptomyces sp. NPDC018031 TaxID=3365033 RepID=UPI0037AE4CFE
MTVDDSPPESVSHRDDQDLLTRVLRVYKPHCRYLRSASVTCAGQPRDGGKVSLRGEFHIPESCYIDDTGHFNSVEFNLCYNQMIYFVMAKSVKERAMWPFDHWTMDEFWARQLPDMFIVDFRSSFRRHMRGRRFWGELDVTGVVERDGGNGPLVLVKTVCRFGEEEVPACHGEVRIAVRKSPPTAHRL